MRWWLGILLVMALLPAAAAEQEQYRLGLEAAAAGHLEEALTALEAARQAGLDTPRLHYNLGVVYYGLGHDEAARRAFRQASRDPELAALSHYNLALLARRAGAEGAARYHFEQAQRLAATERLRELAGRGLAELPPPRHAGQLELGAGYDGTVGSRLADLRAPLAGGDLFAGGWLYGDYRLSAGGLHAFADASLLRYAEESEADFGHLEAGLLQAGGVAGWDAEAAVAVHSSRLDASAFEHGARLTLGAARPLGYELDLALRYRFGLLAGGPDHRYLDGSQQDLRLRLRGAAGPGAWSADYSFEYNDRRDLDGADYFFSASPRRHRLGASLTLPWQQRQLVLGVGLRHSRFAAADRWEDQQRRRVDRRLEASAVLQQPLSAGPWSAFLRLDWLDNDSTIADFRYRGVRLSSGLGRAF